MKLVQKECAVAIDSNKANKVIRRIKQNYELYLFLLPTAVLLIILNYVPMYGVTLAFKDFVPTEGITGSSWVGFKYFIDFFNSFQFKRIITNTLVINISSLIFGFPVPIIVALMLNQVYHERYKRFIQTVTYAPHFISTVVLVGMMSVFLSPKSGIINRAIELLGGQPVFFMSKPEWVTPLYILSDLWQNTGWNTIIYLGALAGINPELYEAAIVDGANKFRRIIHIDIPVILPTSVILLIFAAGNIMSVGFDKIFLMQNSLNRVATDVIPTYVYEMGLVRAQFSLSTAVNLFNSTINIIMLIKVNKIVKKLSDTSLF